MPIPYLRACVRYLEERERVEKQEGKDRDVLQRLLWGPEMHQKTGLAAQLGKKDGCLQRCIGTTAGGVIYQGNR